MPILIYFAPLIRMFNNLYRTRLYSMKAFLHKLNALTLLQRSSHRFFVKFSTMLIAFNLIAIPTLHAWKNPFQSHTSHYKDISPISNTAISHIALSQLPKEALKTLRLIQSNGPFPYADKDGSIYSNRERTLPQQKRGYYTEYTVKTPHARNRGARRIIAGQGTTNDPATSGEYFYTADHYTSFSRIDLDQ
jgi:ribonuclease T1